MLAISPHLQGAALTDVVSGVHDDQPELGTEDSFRRLVERGRALRFGRASVRAGSLAEPVELRKAVREALARP